MNIFEKVKSLNFPVDQYVVFGSGPMTAHGIKELNDIDLFVAAELFDQLRQQNEWQLVHWDNGQPYLVQSLFEVHKRWKFGSYNPDINFIIKNAQIINGVPFAALREVINYKREFARPKDIKDIELIESYLAEQA